MPVLALMARQPTGTPLTLGWRYAHACLSRVAANLIGEQRERKLLRREPVRDTSLHGAWSY